ncbi:MAG TPA: Hpt domain-containing protein [Anaerolineaceae bacterium]|jgi:HPt (histidine-containing phosphotransfer) domain-containing protein|nr:Hpt domain-containing protein [Anaerolineaceae bacterium]NMD26854.1 Hpt domain-containing protein [Chloroflexota bacterium]HOA21297.1 Hpt domain-containing protein [Anaerolineaceae bacterium]HOG77235.1 Hpt domain-containing protein [Anaerolineaceae bacterium]
MDDLTAVDLKTFENLREQLGADFLPGIVDIFCEDVLLQLQTAESALASGDQSGFTRAVHSIKSTSLSFGALDFGAEARELEALGRAGDLEQAKARFPLMLRACPSLRQNLKELCRA